MNKSKCTCGMEYGHHALECPMDDRQEKIPKIKLNKQCSDCWCGIHALAIHEPNNRGEEGFVVQCLQGHKGKWSSTVSGAKNSWNSDINKIKSNKSYKDLINEYIISTVLEENGLYYELKKLGYRYVTNINPPLHGSTVGFDGCHTLLSYHGDFLLFHYYGGNRTIRTVKQLRRISKFLNDSWKYNE